MSAEFDKDFIPIWCEGCNKQGEVFLDDLEQPYFVICPKCGWETSSVWCPKCQIGGEFVASIEKRPMSWVCPECQTEYSLPALFYEQPVFLYLENDLPDEVRARVRSPVNSRYSIGMKLIRFTGFVGMALTFISLFARKWEMAGLCFVLTLAILLAIGRWMRKYSNE